MAQPVNTNLMAQPEPVAAFVPQEIAYRIQNMAGTAKWKRRVISTEQAFAKLMEQLSEKGAEIECRDAEGL